MSDNILTQLSLLIVGAALGVVGTVVKSYFARRAELKKREEMAWRTTLSPLHVAAKDFKEALDKTFSKVYAEREIDLRTVPLLSGDFYLRKWFEYCKNEYILELGEKRSSEARSEDIARHSGGAGNWAISTLYITAYYLYYATQVRLGVPFIGSKTQAQRLFDSIDIVRRSLDKIKFYPVTQESTGVSMTNSAGAVMNYREFCEAIIDTSQRGWFLTLADVYYQLHQWERDNINPILQALDSVVKALDHK